MKKPSIQFYPADWFTNQKLRRCSHAARGAWIDILCTLHDSDEYGVARFPLAELAQVAGAPLKLVKELADKGVLKGADKGNVKLSHTPTHAGKDLEPVVLLDVDGPCWYSSRFLRDEWVRGRRGAATRFTADNQPHPMETADGAASRSPTRRVGERVGDGPSTSTSTSVSTSTVEAKASTGADGAGNVSEDAGKPPWWPVRNRYGRVTSEVTDKIMFDVGKAVLGGKSSGGVVQLLRTAYGGDMVAVVDLLMQADEKSDPGDWIGGVLKKAKANLHVEPKHVVFPKEIYR